MTLMLLVVAWLLTYLAHSTILLGGAWLLSALRIVRRHGARDVVWKVAIVGGLFTATAQLALPAHPTAARVSLNSAAESPIVEASGSLPFAAPAVPVRVQFASIEDATGAPVQVSRVEPPSAPAPLRLGSFHAGWPGMLLNLWLFGALACLGSLLFTRHEMHRRIKDRRDLTDGPVADTLASLLVEEGFEHPVRLTVSANLSSPISFGAAEICLPERALSLGGEELRAVLAHELGHLIRRDPLWRFGTAIVASVLFVQPLNRVARRRMHEVAEFLCDDWAAARTGGGLVLARCLAEVATWIRPGPELRIAAAMASRPSQLLARVQRLLDGVADAGSRRARLAALGLGVAALGLVAWTAPGVESHALTAAPAAAKPAKDKSADGWAAAASSGGDGWLAVREGGRLLVLNPGYSMRLTGRGRLGFREWGRAIELPEGYSVRVAGETIAEDRDVCTDEAVRIVGPEGDVAWTVEPVLIDRRGETRVASVERRREAIVRSLRAADRGQDPEAEAKLDAAIDTLVRAWSRDPAAVRAAAQRIAETFDDELAPQFESLGVALGRDLAPRLERVTNHLGRDLSPEFARMGAELGRSLAASLLDLAAEGATAGSGTGDYRVKRDPKQRE